MLSFSQCLVCLCVLFIYTISIIIKRKDIVESKFLRSVEGSCCDHITGGVNVYLYGCVILLVPECAMCLFVCVCDIKSEYQ